MMNDEVMGAENEEKRVKYEKKEVKNEFWVA